MEYRSGVTGRVFAVRFDHEDNVISELTALVSKENIRCGWFHLLGAIKEAAVVTGPREPVMPPEPVWKQISGPQEIVGVGSIFWDEEQPIIHTHSVFGHHGDTLCGCLRKQATVYLIVEAFIMEITGMDAHRPFFPKGGFNRLSFR